MRWVIGGVLACLLGAAAVAGVHYEAPAPLEVYRSTIIKEGDRWFLHIVGYKHRKCGQPQLHQWQSGGGRTYQLQDTTGVDTDPGPMDNAFQLPFINKPGDWKVETILRYPCEEGNRYVPIETYHTVPKED